MAAVTVYRARVLLNPTPQRRVECLWDGALIVEASNGSIVARAPTAELGRHFSGAPTVDFGPHSVLLPGLVDVHTHLPQYPAMGQDRGELLTWLRELIFPLEAQYADPDFAERQAESFFRTALEFGTTTLLTFGPPTVAATSRAFTAAARVGLRVFMGQTLMDRNIPVELSTPADDALQALERIAGEWHGYDGRLFLAVSPRFAGSCSLELLQLCSRFAQQHQLLLQTHLAESPQELRWIAQLFPDFPDYTAIYEAAGLLTPRTIFAHCIYLSPSEQARLRSAGCAIAHCPRSNVFLRSGIMPLRRYLREGFRVGLGTDVGAGYSLSVLEEARYACEIAKLRTFLAPEEIPTEITPEEALWLATLGGAQALGLEHRIGSLDPGKEADFIVTDASAWVPPVTLQGLAPEALFSRLLYTAPPSSLKAVFVRGRRLR
ncbi:MAG: guanine deaminase [Candidatus Kapabacteria bacterium]|nr:guanine deaminase [Candidatus Kapabacteria bacterium]MDW8012464.1 guanine deaminase [Bacteroidota bacterium]